MLLLLALLLLLVTPLRSSPAESSPHSLPPRRSLQTQPEQWDLELSCLLSRQPDIKASYGQFCQFADWPAARAFVKSEFNYADTGLPISGRDQFAYAEYLFKAWLRSVAEQYSSVSLDKSSACSEALQRLACTTAFPECPMTGSTATSIAYLPPCRLQCEQAQSMCGIVADKRVVGALGPLDCSAFQTENCFIYVPTGYFVLSAQKGPYGDMTAFYAVVLAAWAALLAWWSRRTFRTYKRKCLKICRSATAVPLTKVVALLFTLSFWATCSHWKMCSSALAVAVVNAQLVYEAACVWLVMCVAHGWEEVDADLSGSKMKAVTGTTLLFYIASSALQISREEAMSHSAYVACVATLYACIYGRVAFLAYGNVRDIEKSVSLLEQHRVPQGFVKPVQHRYVMHAVFLALVLLSMTAEVVVQALLGSSAGFGAAMLVYEMFNTLLVGTALYVFRPQEYSPFYFMKPIDRRTALGAADLRGGAISVEVVEDSDPLGKLTATSSVEVELLPLLARRDESSTATSLVVVHGPARVGIGSQVDMQHN